MNTADTAPRERPDARSLSQSDYTTASPGSAGRLIACFECDLLQYDVVAERGATVRCRRCGALFYRAVPRGSERTLAWMLAGALLFAVANGFPLVALDIQGVRRTMSLWSAAQALIDQDMAAVAALFLFTVVVAPALQLSILAYLLLGLRHGQVWPGFGPLLRMVSRTKPWSMIEVFMLGALVSLVKLADVATVIPGVALWALGGLMFAMAAGMATFDAHDAWNRAATGNAQW